MVIRKQSNSKTSSKASTTTSRSYQLSQQQMVDMIRKQAYELYCRRGNNAGDATGDWINAERMVRKNLGLK